MNMKKNFTAKSAKNIAPLASDIPRTIHNYNRALPWLATAGSLGKKDMNMLKLVGFKTIIDLRTTSEGTEEEKDIFNDLGLRYENIEVANEITAQQLKTFTDILDNADKPILVHCATANRVGGMLALYHIQNGMDVDTAMELGRAANMTESYEQLIRDGLKNRKTKSGLRPKK